MKNFIATLFAFLFVFSTAFVTKAQTVNIIPKPKNSTYTRSLPFEFSNKTKIFASDDLGRKTAGILNDMLLKNYGFKLEFTQNLPSKNFIQIEPQRAVFGGRGDEEYKLNITKDKISVEGYETGQFYALQTLMQILPVELKGKIKLPGLEITDEPRFKYRGMHLDVGRHFMPVSFVKKYIDLMSQYKFNQFHWHLTEDQGWRIEIKKYPKLTEIGSKRPETMLEKNFQPYIGDKIPVEGFYTQEQIKDVVAYAKARKINVIPEIELPGHSSAALAAYPEFGCKKDYQYKIQTTWGIFKEVFCPTETTFKFLEDVLEETIALFPDSPYIHIGGDEVLKDHWKESAEVKELMKRENLKDEHEVQSYFIRRMEKFINSKGKKIIGWDEILEGGLAPNATVMSWRGEKGGIEAAKAKHDVIMTPTNTMYFDYGQGDPKFEPINIGNQVSTETVYNYNPIPKELTEDEAKYVLGAQGNVWTEYMKTPEKVEYMVFPRMLALSEVVWTPLEAKNFQDFWQRTGNHFSKLDKQSVNYRIPEPIGLKNMMLAENEKAKIELTLPFPNAKILYSLDGSEPTKIYDKPIELNLKKDEAVELRTVVVNAKQRKSVIYTATVTNRKISPTVEVIDKYPFINYSFHKNLFKSVNELDSAKPTESGTTKSIQLPQFAERTEKFKQPFGAVFSGLIQVPKVEIYEFQIEADDGAILEIDGEKVVDADGTNGKTVTKYGMIPLKQGLHRIKLKYIQTGDNAVLNLRWGIKGTGLRRIYGNELFN